MNILNTSYKFDYCLMTILEKGEVLVNTLAPRSDVVIMSPVGLSKLSVSRQQF